MFPFSILIDGQLFKWLRFSYGKNIFVALFLVHNKSIGMFCSSHFQSYMNQTCLDKQEKLNIFMSV